MGKHDATVRGRHTLPLPVVEPPAPRRPRVRNDKYNGAVSALTAVLTANLFLIVIGLGTVIMLAMQLGPKDFAALVIVLFALFCFRRRR